MQIPYITKDVFSLNNYLIYKNTDKINCNMTERTIKFKMFSNYDQLLDKSKFNYTGNNGDLEINVNYDSNFKEDAFKLKITKNNKVTITSKNERGIRYAFQVLNGLAEKMYDDMILPIVEIYDEPSFKVRGIIEGFYGTPWSHENRLDVIDFMDKYRFNAFMYAPKDDEYHRDKWRELYPTEDLEKLITYKNKCDDKEIDFYYCISPGKDFNYLDENDFELLYKKLDQVIEKGINNFALLMDDIDYKLSEENKKIFKRPGLAHAYITNKIDKYIKENTLSYDFMMCPTEYHQAWDSQYRNDLKVKLNEHIKIFYTGDKVCAEVIDENDVIKMNEIYGHDVVLWENYPVNDFWKSRIFLGPIINRTSLMNRHFDSMVANPMNQWHASKISLVSIAHYMWNIDKYNPEISFADGVKEVVGLEHFEDMMNFAKANYASIFSNDQLLTHKYWVENKEFDKISEFYQTLKISSEKLINTDYPVVIEIKDWLQRAIDEAEIVKLILENKIDHETLIKFIEKPIVLGIELVNLLIKQNDLLTEEEYAKYVLSLLSGAWWKVWEDKL